MTGSPSGFAALERLVARALRPAVQPSGSIAAPAVRGANRGSAQVRRPPEVLEAGEPAGAGLAEDRGFEIVEEPAPVPEAALVFEEAETRIPVQGEAPQRSTPRRRRDRADPLAAVEPEPPDLPPARADVPAAEAPGRVMAEGAAEPGPVADPDSARPGPPRPSRSGTAARGPGGPPPHPGGPEPAAQAETWLQFPPLSGEHRRHPLPSTAAAVPTAPPGGPPPHVDAPPPPATPPAAVAAVVETAPLWDAGHPAPVAPGPTTPPEVTHPGRPVEPGASEPATVMPRLGTDQRQRTPGGPGAPAHPERDAGGGAAQTTVRIDRIEVVTPAARRAQVDALSSLAARREGSSRHSGAR